MSSWNRLIWSVNTSVVHASLWCSVRELLYSSNCNQAGRGYRLGVR